MTDRSLNVTDTMVAAALNAYYINSTPGAVVYAHKHYTGNMRRALQAALADQRIRPALSTNEKP